MPNIIQADYEQLETISASFGQHAENNTALTTLVRQGVTNLKRDWEGKGSAAFLAEMEGEVFPALQRLTEALEQARSVTLEVKNIIQTAEEEAAAPFRGGAAVSTPIGEGRGETDRGKPESVPLNTTLQPRVYIINGINSEGNINTYDLNGNPISGDDQSIAMEQVLERYGYDPDQVKSTQAIYQKPHGTNLSGTNLEGTNYGGWLSPIDWVTGGAAWGVNKLTGAGADAINDVTDTVTSNPVYSSVYGSLETVAEYAQGEHGKYTEQIYKEIAKDLEENPLAPGQTIVIMAHSGGGAVAGNLPRMIEQNLGYDVSGVVTMGSPVSNYDEAGRYAETIVQVRHEKDFVGLPFIRSEESRVSPVILPLNVPVVPKINIIVGVEVFGRNFGANPNVEAVTLDRPADDPHGSYMHDPSVSVDMLHELNRIFPEMSLQLP